MKCEGCGREGTLEPEKEHHGHVHVRCHVCGWKGVASSLSNQIQITTIYHKGKKAIIVKPKIKDWIGGVTIICKRCGNVEIVNEGSLCDEWKLCRKCAQEQLRTIIK